MNSPCRAPPKRCVNLKRHADHDGKQSPARHHDACDKTPRVRWGKRSRGQSPLNGCEMPYQS
eukprot:6463458-Amphidinium_carterae.2